MTETVDERAPLRPTVQCILCSRDYPREEREKYRPLGIFENYCMCEECLYHDKHGWPWHQ